MNAKKTNIVKKIVDACMTVLLLCLMAYQVTGETLHEWFGIGMTVLLIVHHVLNRKWYGALFKGKYNAYRVVTVIVSTLLLAAIALTAVCGMAMSAHAVPFLYGVLPVSFARQTHLAMSFWSFILMGVHLGLHIPAMTAGLKWNGKVRTAVGAAFAIVSGVGFWLFVKNGIPNYIFFRTPLAFFDYEKNAALVFAENLAVLIAFAFLGACAALLIKAGKNAKKRKANRAVPAVLVLVSLLIAAVLLFFTGEKQASDASRNDAAPQTETTATDVQGTSENRQTEAPTDLSDGFLLIEGGAFLMGSPGTENWRIDDETQHEVTVSAFYIDPYETTQKEYARIMGDNPSAFSGDDLPVDRISWTEALLYANAKSLDAGQSAGTTLSPSLTAASRT